MERRKIGQVFYRILSTVSTTAQLELLKILTIFALVIKIARLAQDPAATIVIHAQLERRKIGQVFYRILSIVSTFARWDLFKMMTTFVLNKTLNS